MPPWKSVTALVLVAAIVGLVLYDLIAYALGGNPATISRMMLRVGQKSLGFLLGVVFVLGVLVGHLFLPQRPRPDEEQAPDEGPPDDPKRA